MKKDKDIYLEKIVSHIVSSLNHNIKEINIQKAKADAYKYSHGEIPFENSIAYQYPELCKEWNTAKNENNTSDKFTSGMHDIVWWQCNNCSNEWQSSINSRISQKSGCTKCGYNCFDGMIHKNAIKQATIGVNDLRTLYPELCKEWNIVKNKENIPECFTRSSNYEAWWICPNCSHEWQTKISNRTLSGRESGCPNCRYNWYKAQTGQPQNLKKNYINYKIVQPSQKMLPPSRTEQ